MFADNSLGLKFLMFEGHAQGPLAMSLLVLLVMVLIWRVKK